MPTLFKTPFADGARSPDLASMAFMACRPSNTGEVVKFIDGTSSSPWQPSHNSDMLSLPS
ncbi:MAG: hypothetical protein ACYDCP_09040 [Thermoplasmataceae archaeon]